MSMELVGGNAVITESSNVELGKISEARSPAYYDVEEIPHPKTKTGDEGGGVKGVAVENKQTVEEGIAVAIGILSENAGKAFS